MITVIDSGIANIGSVVAAFRRIGVAVTVTTNPELVASARSLVLPGVGAFADGMESLRQKGLIDPIRDAVTSGVPILGICLGMQLLSDVSEEFGKHQGLGLIPGRVVRLAPSSPQERVPNIGWCDASICRDLRLFAGMQDFETFYFVHSYHLQCADPRHSAATIAFGQGAVTVAVEHANIFGVQFHPEKSQDAGLRVLSNYTAQAVGISGETVHNPCLNPKTETRDI